MTIIKKKEKVQNECWPRPNYNSPAKKGGAFGVMVIVIGNGHSDMSSNPGQDWWYFT